MPFALFRVIGQFCWVLFCLTLFIYLETAHACYDTHVEVRGQLESVLLPRGFWRSKPAARAFAHEVISAAATFSASLSGAIYSKKERNQARQAKMTDRQTDRLPLTLNPNSRGWDLDS